METDIFSRFWKQHKGRRNQKDEGRRATKPEYALMAL